MISRIEKDKEVKKYKDLSEDLKKQFRESNENWEKRFECRNKEYEESLTELMTQNNKNTKEVIE